MCRLPIVSWWRSLSASNKFTIAYPVWFLILFGIFYWGHFWDLSKIGQYLDSFQREMIMSILGSSLDNQIDNYDIIINSQYHVVITPECNGLVPYFIFLAGVLAYPFTTKCKILWGIMGYFIFTIVNLIRLYLVTILVNRYGGENFFYFHDIGCNILLIATGGLMFIKYLSSCIKIKQ